MRVVSRAELAAHCSADGCWIALHGRVYDCTAFLAQHPGGAQLILDCGGRDATDAFEAVGHSALARDAAEALLVGVLEGYQAQPDLLQKRRARIDPQLLQSQTSAKLFVWVGLAGLALALLLLVFV